LIDLALRCVRSRRRIRCKRNFIGLGNDETSGLKHTAELHGPQQAVTRAAITISEDDGRRVGLLYRRVPATPSAIDPLETPPAMFCQPGHAVPVCGRVLYSRVSLSV